MFRVLRNSTQLLILMLCFLIYFLQKEWRENYSEFKRKVARCVRRSQEECKKTKLEYFIIAVIELIKLFLTIVY